MGNTIYYEQREDGRLRIVGSQDTSCRTLEIPETLDGVEVVEIADEAFSHYFNLTEIILPHTLLRIGFRAFTNCRALRQVYMHDTLQEIADEAFSWCVSLTSTHTDSHRHASDKLVLPSGLLKLGAGAFKSCTSLIRAELPPLITMVPEAIFSGCTKLRSIIVSDKTKCIENLAFDGCSSIMAMTLPEGMTAVGEHFLRGCTALRSLRLPASLQAIPDDLLPNSMLSVTVIAGSYAADWCAAHDVKCLVRSRED